MPPSYKLKTKMENTHNPFSSSKFPYIIDLLSLSFS